MQERPQTAPAKAKEEGTAITVVVRVRPFNQRELNGPQGNAIHILDDKVLVFDPHGERTQKKTFLSNSQGRAKNQTFAFDKVFGPSNTQEDVFEVVKNTIFPEKGGLLDGFNCTVFAYGATGSGKTFSMAGSPDNEGIMSRSVQHIFESIEKHTGRTAKIRMSYLEIYNEQIKDLLNPSDDPSKELKIVEDPENGIVVTGLSSCYPTDTEEVLKLVQIGNNRRTQAQTEANPVSSRSHAVLQIVVENCDEVPGMTTTSKIGKLSLIDLAGSERATQNTGKRLRETTKINCSLLALSNCINMLCKSSAYIPFRQSKLTRLLKDSLGGNCKTICLSCLSPSYLTYEDSYNTLQYANKAKNIKTNVTKNTINVKAHISEYQAMIERLRSQVQTLQAQRSDNSSIEAYSNSIQEPYLSQRQRIEALFQKSMPSSSLSAADAVSQMSHSDFKKSSMMAISDFVNEAEKFKPQGEIPSKWINQESYIKKLELENFALKANSKFYEHQIYLQQQIINTMKNPDAAVHEEVSSVSEIEKVIDIDSETTFNTLPPPPMFDKPFSARLRSDSHVSIMDMSRIRAGRTIERNNTLREKFEEAQKAQRKPLSEKSNSIIVNGLQKQPLNTLMDQLSKKIQSINKIDNEEEKTATGILLRSRLLKQVI